MHVSDLMIPSLHKSYLETHLGIFTRLRDGYLYLFFITL